MTKQFWVRTACAAIGPTGVVVSRFVSIGPNPQTFFWLGVVATFAAGGTIWGLVNGIREVRAAAQRRVLLHVDRVRNA